MFTVILNNVNKEQIELVGGKGANLGELIRAGFSVPQGFCITSTAYDEYIKSNGFDGMIDYYLGRIHNEPEQAAQLSDQIVRIITEGVVTKELYSEIAASYEHMGNNCRVAVRSSATAEDLPENSFAGQQETYLNICGLEELIRGIKKCFASLWSHRAIDYRKQTGFDKQKVSLAVVVQEMVEGEVSGVLFSANPMNQNREEMVINASYGLGESVVSGIVTPDTFIWSIKKNRMIDRFLGSKEIAVVYDKEQDTIKKKTDIQQQKRYCISQKEIEMLIAIGKEIEQHYGCEQDIEWTMKDGCLYILQARGITTLTKKADEAQQKAEKMIMEMTMNYFSQPPYPLELHLLNVLFNDFTAIFNSFGVKLEHNPIRIDEGGKIYFKLSSDDQVIEPKKPSPQRTFEENISNMEKVMTEIRSEFEAIQIQDISHKSLNDMMESLKKLSELAQRIYRARNNYCNMPYRKLYPAICEELKSAGLDSYTEGIFSELSFKSWDMNVELGELASIINQNDFLKERILLLSADKDKTYELEKIAQDYPAFGNQYRRIFKNFGWKSTDSHRALSAVSWNEDKQFFLTLLRLAMKQENKWKFGEKYSILCDQIRKTFRTERADNLLQKIEEMRKYHQDREDSVYMLEWCYGLNRKLLRELVSRFPQLFHCYEDILFLLMDEVLQLTDYTLPILAERIEVRKKAISFNQKMWDDATHTPEELNSGKDISVLNGCSGSSGKVKGKVRVIIDASEFGKLHQGEILVCPLTDPIWTPLFANAKAVITDVGGPLAHSAIVAREYGIPAVMGCRNATKTLMDGQEVIVDGSNGTVCILTGGHKDEQNI